MPYKVKVIKASIRDSDGSTINFDILAGDYEKKNDTSLTLDDIFNSSSNNTGSDNDGV